MQARLPIFWRVMAITGPIYALAAIPLVATDSWLRIALWLFGIAIIFGGALGLIVLLVQHTLLRLLAMILIVPALSLGLFIGAGQLPHGAWVQLSAVPARVVSIDPRTTALFWGNGILVWDDQGDLWRYACGSNEPCAWEQITPAMNEGLDSFYGHGECPADYAEPEMAPRPPKHVVAAHAIKACYTDYNVTQRTVLLENGSIWVWVLEYSVYAWIGLYILALLVGLGFAVLTPLILWIAGRVAARRARGGRQTVP